jgi:hypothetical protein
MRKVYRKAVLFMLFFGNYLCSNAQLKRDGGVVKDHPFITNHKIETPTIFYPGVVSTSIDKFNTSFSPDGLTIYYTATSQKLGITGIAFQQFENGAFSSPEFVPFVSSDIPVADVQISRDGNTMLYTTFKNYEGKAEGFHFDIWIAEKEGTKWSKTYPLKASINSAGNEFYPVMTNDETIYFNSDISGNSDLYFSRKVNGAYQDPVRLPDNINSKEREADTYIAPDQSYIIFVRVDAEDGFGNSDLYISFNIGNNQWTDPKNLGSNVNSSQIDGSPCVSPDGRYLFFTSGRQEEGVKARAMTSYEDFISILSSHKNGNLNTYYMSFNPDDYR